MSWRSNASRKFLRSPTAASLRRRGRCQSRGRVLGGDGGGRRLAAAPPWARRTRRRRAAAAAAAERPCFCRPPSCRRRRWCCCRLLRSSASRPRIQVRTGIWRSLLNKMPVIGARVIFAHSSLKISLLLKTCVTDDYRLAVRSRKLSWRCLDFIKCSSRGFVIYSSVIFYDLDPEPGCIVRKAPASSSPILS